MPIHCLLAMRGQMVTRVVIVSVLFPWQAAWTAEPECHLPGTSVLAPSIDLRPALERWGLAPRQQGKRGTCSVFTVAGAAEYALANKSAEAKRLSVEYLNWAANQVSDQKDDGAFFSDLWRGLELHGVCLEGDMPYRAAFDPDYGPSQAARDRAIQLRQTGMQLHWIKPWNPHTGLTDRQLVCIKQVLNEKWPVCSGFRWPKKPMRTEGVLEMPPPDGVVDGHSVLLVGYRDDAQSPGGGVFLLRDSHYEGDGLMTYAYARAYMNDAAWIDVAAPASESLTAGDLVSPLRPLPAGRNRRVSSNQQPQWHSENLDMNWLMPGQSVDIPVLEGPGVITHIWFTSHAGWVGELNSLTLRVFYDGSPQPGVEVPLGDFFAVGQGTPAVVSSIPVQVSPTGSLTCYWRMPFQQSARIVVTNDNPDRSTGLYWQVDWLQLPELPPTIPYFYARYRQEYPAEMGRDYVLADLRGTGYYVGTVMSVTLGQSGWFGEGDDFFYIDGEQVPSLQGTGSEDYFNDAWGFRARTGPWFGQPRWQGDAAGDSGVCYRWHIPDPVHFTQSLKVAIEHRGNRDESEDGFFLERPDFLSSVAFWYQVGWPEADFPPLPSWHRRRVPWQHQHLVRAYRHVQTSGPAKVSVQTQGFFGARPVLAWLNQQPGATLTVPFTVADDGRYAIRLTAAKGPAQGVFDVLLDDSQVLTAEFRAAEDAELDLALGTHDLKQGPHTVGFRASERPEQAGALSIEVLRLLKLPPEAKRTQRTHHEAHFIRLGIGRAVYAHRLAFDTLPDSLQMLVDKGLMPARYLSDENHLPLKSWREGDTIIVESSGQDAWKHSWRGLDARR